jgi:hypothetical protein
MQPIHLAAEIGSIQITELLILLFGASVWDVDLEVFSFKQFFLTIEYKFPDLFFPPRDTHHYIMQKIVEQRPF